MAPKLLGKCCFCIPLQRGLLVWGYVKLVISLILLLRLTMISYRTITYLPKQEGAVIFLDCVSTAIPDLLDVGFTIVLIIAAHKKNSKMMQLYYYYTITILGLYILVTLLTTFNSHRFEVLQEIIFHYIWPVDFDFYSMLIVSTMIILVQAYLMLVVRSVLHELLNSDCTKENFESQKCSGNFKVIGTLPSPTPATDVVNITTDI